MKKETAFFQSDDGLKLATCAHHDSATPKAYIVLVHGYGEHAGRYAHVVDALCGAGYSVHTIDHRGHGASDGERAYFNNLWEPVADLKRFVNDVQAQNSNRALFMLGHSMGALIALVFAIQYQYELKGVILSGIPLTADLSTSPVLLAVGNLLNLVAPKMQLADAAPRNELSSDPSVMLDFQADPLNWKGKMRVRMGISIQRAAKWSRANIGALKLPIMLAHGADDKICPPSGSQFVFDGASSTDKTLKFYPGMKHEILNERERAGVIADMIAWCDAHA